jgi:hypothetical protein
MQNEFSNMVEITNSVFIFLIALIFLEAFIIIGDWINCLSSRGEVLKNIVKPGIMSFLKVVIFVIFVVTFLDLMFPLEFSTIAIGILSGIASGGCIMLLDKRN